jgi:ABC-type uncharacterized transport system permease subunit
MSMYRQLWLAIIVSMLLALAGSLAAKKTVPPSSGTFPTDGPLFAALLGGSHPAGIIISSLGIAALQVGSGAMQRMAGVPTSISWIAMGLVVLLILARRRKARE